MPKLVTIAMWGNRDLAASGILGGGKAHMLKWKVIHDGIDCTPRLNSDIGTRAPGEREVAG